MIRRSAGTFLGRTLLLACLAPVVSDAQERADSSMARPTMRVAVAEGRIRIDGRLDDPAWENAPSSEAFYQREPDPGAPVSERTEVRALIDESALYVAYRCWVEDPSTLVARLARRDDSGVSDRVWVDIGSVGDGRTAFSFSITPAGSRQDILIFDDGNEDPTWDAVWEGAAARFDGGYTAEFRIPFSQLRFPHGREADSWAIQFQRDIPANGEVSFWSPILPEGSGYVSRFGRLEGLGGLRPPRRIELVPYVAGRLTRAPGDPADPFYNENDVYPTAGADARLGLTSGLTLTATINPDFGQVEADPAVVNLSAYETFFEERRPFFVEGTDVFAFGNTRTNSISNRPTFLYTRRIGRPPLPFGRVHPGTVYDFADTPDETTIAGAAKVSGRVGPWSIGLLNALTTPESAAYYDSAGALRRAPVEPLANYLVGRFRRGWDDGATVVGGFVSAVNRDMSPEFDELVPGAAYVVGLDAEHAISARMWTFSGVAAFSTVQGSAASSLQLAPQRYYQRPDQSYLDLDLDVNRLSGYRGEFSAQRSGGTHWRGSLTASITSPGFETNDLGFQSRADYVGYDWFVQHIQPRPAGIFRRWSAFGFGAQGWNYGGDIINHFYGLDAVFTHPNLWSSRTRAMIRPVYINDRLTRGGPLGARPSDWTFLALVTTDRSRRVSANIAFNTRQELRAGHSEELEYDYVVDGYLAMRVTPSFEVQLIPLWSTQLDTDQYVDDLADGPAATFGRRYVFADVRQDDLSLGLRADWTLRPDLSIQVYLAPGITSARFDDYKEFASARTYDWVTYGRDRGTISPVIDDEGLVTGYDVDPGDGGAPFGVPNLDFTYLNMRGNAVVRWEYRPASTLFFVWQQVRDDFGAFDGFDLGSDYGRVFDAPAQSVFLLKATFWLGL